MSRHRRHRESGTTSASDNTNGLAWINAHRDVMMRHGFRPVPVCANSVGTFNALATDRGRPIVVGDRVVIGECLGTIEEDLFGLPSAQPVEIDFTATVLKLFVRSGDPVEYGEPLFLADPVVAPSPASRPYKIDIPTACSPHLEEIRAYTTVVMGRIWRQALRESREYFDVDEFPGNLDPGDFDMSDAVRKLASERFISPLVYTGDDIRRFALTPAGFVAYGVRWVPEFRENVLRVSDRVFAEQHAGSLAIATACEESEFKIRFIMKWLEMEKYIRLSDVMRYPVVVSQVLPRSGKESRQSSSKTCKS
jgi:biotin carboxyl carrier protein